MSHYGLYGKLTAKPGRRDGLINNLLRAAELMKQAPGCRVYVVNASADEPEVVWVTEIWDSRTDHDNSLAIVGVGELIQRTMTILAGPPEQVRLEPRGGVGL